MRRTDRERDSSDAVAVRHLDEMQEQEPHPGASKLGAMIMASFGGACIVFCSLALVRGPDGGTPKGTDPLGDLVAAQPAAKKKAKPGLDPDDVTFPEVLSDQPQKTTAMAAVKNDRDELPRGAGRGAAGGPPPATDRLPVVPLPAQDVLGNDLPLPVASADRLQNAAHSLAREPDNTKLADPGGPGGYQLQVSSFKSREEGEAFAMALRRRGHKAHVEEANVAGRGMWYRVRVGPFKYKRSAQIYREEFEAKERMVTFIVDPPKNAVSISISETSE
jgi:DedD protein